MASTNLLDTKTITFGELFSNGKIYRVPTFQRDYSWEEENWEDLWTDMLNIRDSGEKHYMGAVVLQQMSDREFRIIDGQQRFTTLSLLSLAVVANLKNLIQQNKEAEANERRVELLMQQFLGHLDPGSLMYSSKLFLNENNDHFYQWNLLNFRPPTKISKLSDSEKLLWEGYQYFLNKIKSLFGDQATGQQLADFLNKTAADFLHFIQIKVEDEVNAYTVFETLNACGVGLTSTDLLKNYLFSLTAGIKSEQDLVKQKWNKIIELVGLKTFPFFLRHYLNSRQDLVYKESLFKTLKTQVKTKTEVFNLLDVLEYFAGIYIALETPEDELWRGEKEVKKHIRELSLFRVVLCKPLLMIVFDKLPGEFPKVLKDVDTIIFRYNIIGKNNANEMERAFNRAAVKVYKGVLATAKDIFNQELKSAIYIDDAVFQNDFSTRAFNTNSQKKLVRYVLYSLEGQLPNGSKYDFEIDVGTIEHVLPENLTPDWEQNFPDEEHEKWVYALGNLTLLEASKNNKQAAAKSFPAKLQVYATSQYALTKEIAAPDWTPQTIRHRQAHLANVATGIWKVQY
ncbi:MAG: DUF262 domain-containing HNH endonuclease family protein [Bacteroidota bacterium]